MINCSLQLCLPKDFYADNTFRYACELKERESSPMIRQAANKFKKEKNKQKEKKTL